MSSKGTVLVIAGPGLVTLTAFAAGGSRSEGPSIAGTSAAPSKSFATSRGRKLLRSTRPSASPLRES